MIAGPRIRRRPIAHLRNKIVIQCIANKKARRLSAHRTFVHCRCTAGSRSLRAKKYIDRLGQAQVHSWHCAALRPVRIIYWKCRHAH